MYDTVELPREAAAWQCRKSKESSTLNVQETTEGTCQKKTFNMNMYKHHALRDYVEAIRTYSMCDSYSTEPVCRPPYVFEE